MTTPYSARIRHVVLIEREKNNVQTLKVYRDDNQVVPTAASYTLKPLMILFWLMMPARV